MAAASRANPASRSRLAMGSLPTSVIRLATAPIVTGVPNSRKTIFAGEAQAAGTFSTIRTDGMTRDCSSQLQSSSLRKRDSFLFRSAVLYSTANLFGGAAHGGFLNLRPA